MDGLFVTPLLAILGEGLLLGVHPVFIESSLELDGQVLSPDGGQSSKSSWGLNVTNDTANNNWWGFKDCACFNDFLLVELFIELAYSSNIKTYWILAYRHL